MNDLVGNTKFFYATFYAKDGSTPADPDEGTVQFIIKNANTKAIETITLGPEHHTGVGTFEYPYVPDTAGNFTFRFKAYFDGLPVLGEVTKTFKQ